MPTALLQPDSQVSSLDGGLPTQALHTMWRPRRGGAGGEGAAHLVHADVALVAEDHLVAIFALGRAAHVTDDILVILDAQPLLRLDGPCHVLVARRLQLLQHALERQLVQLWPLCEDSRAGASGAWPLRADGREGVHPPTACTTSGTVPASEN